MMMKVKIDKLDHITTTIKTRSLSISSITSRCNHPSPMEVVLNLAPTKEVIQDLITLQNIAHQTGVDIQTMKAIVTETT